MYKHDTDDKKLFLKISRPSPGPLYVQRARLVMRVDSYTLQGKSLPVPRNWGKYSTTNIGMIAIGDVANSKRPLLVIPKMQLRLRVTRRSATALARYPQKLQKLFAGKNLVKILVTAQTQLRSYSEQQRAFGNSNICNSSVHPRDVKAFT